MLKFAVRGLDAPLMRGLARAMLTSFFLLAGLFGLFNFSAVVGEMEAAALPLPVVLAVLTIATQLLGSALFLGNFKGLGWLGAFALAVFTLLCIPLGHPFWTEQDAQTRTVEMQIALEHFALAGGLLLAAAARRAPGRAL